MVPLYTFFVEETSDFGYYDLCFTMILLLMSFTTLQLRDGVFRFLLDTDDTTARKKIVSFVYRTLISNTLIALVMTVVVLMFTTIHYAWYCFALLIAMSFYEVIPQIARGLGKNKEFVLTGIISSTFIAIYSIIFVIMLDMGIKGIFIANILARITALIFLDCRLKIIATYFKFNLDLKEIGRDILKYSLPLIPASLCWWLTTGSDRWFITQFVGLDANGVYAVAARFTGIIQTLAFIYYQAWQETAILQYNSADRDKFFSKMFNSYICILAILLTAYTFMLKIFYPIIVDTQYQESINYIYPLGISAVLFALVYFFDMGYQCAKDTPRTLPAIILAATINIVLNFILVRQIGAYGAITTAIITYLVLFVYRLHDMKRYFKLTFYRNTTIAALIIPLGAIAFQLIDAWWMLLAYMIIACVICYFSMSQETRIELQDKVLKKIGIGKQ